MSDPIREELPVDLIAKRLRGASKEAWLEKWSSWILDLLNKYNVSDVQEALGIKDPTELESLERFLVEHCHGLTETECLHKIDSVLREKGYRKNVIEEMAEAMEDYIKAIERQPEILYALPPDIRAEISRLRARPELDENEAYKLVYNFLVSEGADPEEANKIAKEIASTIKRLPPEKRRIAYEYAVSQAKVVKQRSIAEWARREKEAEAVKFRIRQEISARADVLSLAGRVASKAEDIVVRTLGRPLASEETQTIFTWSYDMVRDIARTKGLSEVEKNVDKIAEDVARSFLSALERAVSLKPIIEEMYREFMSATTLKAIPWKEVVTKFRAERPRTAKNFEELITLIATWAAPRGYRIVYRRGLRYNFPFEITIHYYEEPDYCVVVESARGNYFFGCNKEVVAYRMSATTIYIFRGTIPETPVFED